jgi:hypothetical protein
MIRQRRPITVAEGMQSVCPVFAQLAVNERRTEAKNVSVWPKPHPMTRRHHPARSNESPHAAVLLGHTACYGGGAIVADSSVQEELLEIDHKIGRLLQTVASLGASKSCRA